VLLDEPPLNTSSDFWANESTTPTPAAINTMMAVIEVLNDFFNPVQMSVIIANLYETPVIIGLSNKCITANAHCHSNRSSLKATSKANLRHSNCSGVT